ncbi:hypothetical protein GCM10025857_28010 [Alicyclobacillus contaminans]|nr:hypothetical protein GCM10025857_28010 [Alicyclobacillus contaminans]
MIVSHSAKLGEGVCELLRQLAGPNLHIASASGLEDRLGTDAIKIAHAIQACPPGSDVVVLFDLGSARLSSEMALELVPSAWRERVFMADAPLVEGAVAAAVEASIGGSVEAVLARAADARQLRKLDD